MLFGIPGCHMVKCNEKENVWNWKLKFNVSYHYLLYFGVLSKIDVWRRWSTELMNGEYRGFLHFLQSLGNECGWCTITCIVKDALTFLLKLDHYNNGHVVIAVASMTKNGPECNANAVILFLDGSYFTGTFFIFFVLFCIERLSGVSYLPSNFSFRQPFPCYLWFRRANKKPSVFQ